MATLFSPSSLYTFLRLQGSWRERISVEILRILRYVAIPRGTLSAIAVSTMIYTTFGLVAGLTYVRDADGIINVKPGNVPDCYSNSTCPFGLHNFYQIVMTTKCLALGDHHWYCVRCAWLRDGKPSQRLENFSGLPTIFCYSSFGEDRLIPAITFFGKGYGAGHDPRRAYALCFVITIAVLMIGNLKYHSPIYFKLLPLRLCSGQLRLLRSNSLPKSSEKLVSAQRLAFTHHGYHCLGAVLCISIMFIMSWPTTLLTFAFFVAVYAFIKHLKPDVNWGTSTTATTYKHAFNGVMKLTKNEPHVKNYRPQVRLSAIRQHLDNSQQTFLLFEKAKMLSEC
ncbi:hypothetical protein COOONC_14023 [Cooperia oncophora]